MTSAKTNGFGTLTKLPHRLSQTSAMTNVVELVSYEMAKLPSIFQRRLCIAACLGNSFQEQILHTVLEEMDEKEDMTADETATNDAGDGQQLSVENWLSFSESCGFLEKQTPTPGSKTLSYQWIHDSVREGALSLVPQEELSQLKGQLGRQLYRSLTGDQLESVTFVMANLLHDSPNSSDESERILLARINLEAAQKAKHVAAFTTAAQYAARGVDLLPEDRWETNKDLTLDLFTVAAITEDMAGLPESVNARYVEVKARVDIPLAAKLEIYASQINSLCNKADQQDVGIALTLSILEQQGIKFPKTTAGRILSTITNLRKVKKKCSELTVADLAELPEMDPEDVGKMKLLNQLTTFCYGSPRYGMIMPLSILAMARLTFKRGVSMFAPPNLAGLGLIFLGVMHDYQLGGKMGILAMNLLEQRKYGTTASFTIFSVYIFLRSWLDPLSSCQPYYMKGYECGLLFGDTEFSSWNIWSYIVSGFQTGRPLNLLESDCRIYSAQVRSQIAGQIRPYWLVFVRLIGNEEQTDPLLGGTEATLSLTDLVEQDKGSTKNLDIAVSALQSRLYAIFGDHEAGAKLALERGDGFQKKNLGLHAVMPETFARGVSLYAMAIQTKNATYTRQAKKVHATIKKWRKAGNPNVIGYEKILDAEDAVLSGKFETAESLYHSAKAISSRSGLVQDAALAAERCGEMLLRRESPSDAAPLLEEAVKLYLAWGAHAKVAQLLRKHSRILSGHKVQSALICKG
ncbi:Transcriptional regulator [Seminavis robusta]|uniref:Transcriptional regulator n=1 Tax=Seminavis robusta TaxID=568900 RepID=A0A9N8DFK9_9STRA|nr:Transcriptional regulator [Seminavis robusta]|eukprot:Sro65_g036760.1 Transcriptional regulator (746) ;mRNA; f:67209-69446